MRRVIIVRGSMCQCEGDEGYKSVCTVRRGWFAGDNIRGASLQASPRYGKNRSFLARRPV